MLNFSQNSNERMQNQQANATNNIASNWRAIMPYGRTFSKYTGVTRIVSRGTFIATAYNLGSIPGIPRTIYLGTYDREEEAARAYDLVTLKLAGPSASLNFPLTDYPKAIAKMSQMSVDDLVSYIRRASDAARGKSRFRGVFRNVQTGKWHARILEAGKENVFGAFDTEEEAAVAFDVACIKERGFQAITNYNLRCYDVRSIFNTTRMQYQVMNANRMRQHAMQLQAINAHKIWQQAMELQAIDAQKLKQKQRETEMRKRYMAAQQQAEADPLRLTLGIRHTGPEKPIARRLGLGYQSHSEEMKEYFKGWALQTARRELASASNMNFKHGEFSPFCSYQEMKLLDKTPKLFDFFAAESDGLRILTPYKKWLEAQGVEAQQASSSACKRHKSDPDVKGKAKVIYDV